jgi:hypothetical protein
MLVANRSSTWRSWVTRTRPPRKPARRSSSQAMASMSRWLVGSSRISRSPSLDSPTAASARARAVRLAWPPDKLRTSASASAAMPTRSSRASARCFPLSALRAGPLGPGASHVSPTACRTVPSGRAAAWSSATTRVSRPRRMTPCSGSTMPANIPSSVDLPDPFTPTTASRSPLATVTDRPANRGLPGRLAARSAASTRITAATVPGAVAADPSLARATCGFRRRCWCPPTAPPGAAPGP